MTVTSNIPGHEAQRQEMADRLIGGSMRRSYNSEIDIDWDAPQDPDLFYLPLRACRCTAPRCGSR